MKKIWVILAACAFVGGVLGMALVMLLNEAGVPLGFQWLILTLLFVAAVMMGIGNEH